MCRNWILVFFVLCQFLASCSNSSSKSECTKDYKVIPEWPDLPESVVLGDVSGVGVDSHDHVFVLHRGPENDPNAADVILKIAPSSGELISSWGSGIFSFPHGLSVDQDDNVWATDLVNHQVYKFSSDGLLLLTLGTKGVSGLDESHFNGPTDVEVDTNGNIYISDGLGNSRITKFNALGQFLYSWGDYGSGLGEFDIPHGLTISADIIYVADRGNARIQLFDINSNFISSWESFDLGRPWGLASNENHIYVVDGGDPGLQDRSHALKIDKGGIIISKWGRHGIYPGEFNVAHDIDVDSQGSVYTVEINGRRVQKFEPCP
jgi:peptidylamidoglycolate lyase